MKYALFYRNSDPNDSLTNDWKHYMTVQIRILLTWFVSPVITPTLYSAFIRCRNNQKYSSFWLWNSNSWLWLLLQYLWLWTQTAVWCCIFLLLFVECLSYLILIHRMLHFFLQDRVENQPFNIPIHVWSIINTHREGGRANTDSIVPCVLWPQTVIWNWNVWNMYLKPVLLHSDNDKEKI